MIFDNIANCDKYSLIDKRLSAAFDFLKKADSSLPDGRYELLPDGEMFASVQSYMTKAPEDSKLEGHRKYIDVQYVLRGTEIIECADISRLRSDIAYDGDRDIEFFEDAAGLCSLCLSDGDFSIFYPNDIHKPGMKNGESIAVKKIVVKIRVI